MGMKQYALIALCMAIAANTVLYAAATAVPLPTADAWYFIDTFVRKAVGNGITLQDFFAQRGAGDHAQPLHRAVLLAHLNLADLDFRVEAIVGAVLGVVTCGLFALTLWNSGEGAREKLLPLTGAVAIFAVGLSLNATNIYTWSLVSLIWISLLVAAVYWLLAATTARASFIALPATFLMASVLDELALPTFAAAVLALLMRDGIRQPWRALGFALSGGVGLAAGRLLIQAMTAGQGSADATGGSLEQLIQVLRAPDAWKILVVPLSDSLVHREHLVAWFPTSALIVEIMIALFIAGLHACFWWRVFLSADRPKDTVVVLAVSLMLFFYASILGIALSRVTMFGVDYFHQPRYTAVYQLNIVALILMFAAPPARRIERSSHFTGMRSIGVAFIVGVVVLQLPLSLTAWQHAKFVRAYTQNVATAMAKLGADPGIGSAPSCPSGLTICNAPAQTRARTFALLRDNRLSIYSPRFRHANDLDRLQAPESVGGPSTASLAAAKEDCDVRILRRGPTRIVPGTPFNRQPNGRSAFWVLVAPGTPDFTLEFEGRILYAVRRGELVTYAHDDAQMAAANAGRPLRFDVKCGGKQVESFEVAVH